VVLDLERELRRMRAIRPAVLMCDWDYPHPFVEAVPYTRIRFRLREPAASLRSAKAVIAWLLTLPAAMYRLHRLLTERRVAVVNIHYPTLSSVVFAIMKMAGLCKARLIVSFHGQDAVHGSQLRGVTRRLFRLLLRTADAITACSHAFADDIRRSFPDECSRITVIHNGVDADRMRDEMSPEVVSQLEPLPMPYVLCVSGFVAEKALDVLIRAFVRVREQHPQYHLVIAGRDGPELDRIIALIHQQGLRSCVSVYVDVPHPIIARMMRGAALFVLPSRMETFGIVLLEAGLAKLPVVASRVGGVPEIISSPDLGVLVPPDDPASLAAAITELLSDSKRMADLGARLSEHVRHSFSLAACTRRYLQVALSDQRDSPKRTLTKHRL
jgi:glycosyltransferase involved in cell wall biosynthesis